MLGECNRDTWRAVVRTVIELRVPTIAECIDYSINCVISGLRREVDENCALLGHYAAGGDNSLATFRNNLSVLLSKVKDS